ncbi:MAG: FtsQ-type POTRA domain-containing protein, partial [Nitrospirae bacterium]|nr:FtsQ-type POTRA domain-containing protein [Nitrospirota bacterium]
MQLKRQKNKGSFANGRGKRVMVFLKRVLLAMSLIAVAAIIVLSIRLADTLFPLQKVIVTGNKNLEEERIKDVMDTGNEKGLLRISLKDVDRKLKTLPWIKKAALRKQFPDAIMINVEESVPMAILDYNGGLFMIDGGGSILEEIKEEKTPFLPVIKGIDYEGSNAD